MQGKQSSDLAYVLKEYHILAHYGIIIGDKTQANLNPNQKLELQTQTLIPSMDVINIVQPQLHLMWYSKLTTCHC